MNPRIVGPGFNERVYEIVGRVPFGRVATYGDVATALGSPTVARHVGFALAALPSERDDVPWHRIVNAKGMISLRSHGARSDRQVMLLQSEDVQVDTTGRLVDFNSIRYR